MTTTYLYLDDGDQAESAAFADAVIAVTPELQIKHEYPSEFSKQITHIEGKSFKADGLILDLRLDQIVHEVDGYSQKADYRAPSLAQEVRTRAAEKRRQEFPIVLWSLDARLKESYQRDRTSHDLFDLIVVKDELKDDTHARSVGQKLKSLVEGYQIIVHIRDNETRHIGWFYRLLGFENVEGASFLDPRLLGHFDSSEIKRPAHEYARFIIRHLFNHPGPLIDKSVLAARLGLDLASSPDIEKLLSQPFADAKYKGVFQNGWERWWTFKIEEIWNKSYPNTGPLRTLNAEERVKALKAKTGFKNLRPAASLHSGYSTRYWTICQKLATPLDPRDGLLLNLDKPYPWQSEQFVSFEAYERRLITRREIDPIDQERLEMMKEQRSS